MEIPTVIHKQVLALDLPIMQKSNGIHRSQCAEGKDTLLEQLMKTDYWFTFLGLEDLDI